MLYFTLVLLGIYIIIMFFRFVFTIKYYNKETEKTKNIKDEDTILLKDVTIFQPILSGDKYLTEKLSFVYENAGEAELIWAVDEDDFEAEKIIKEITKNNTEKKLHVIKCSKAPFYENPKVYKIIQTEKLWRKYTVILDDDTITDIKMLSLLNKEILETSIVTGIPYYLKAGSMWENLVRAYVNSNSVYNYFTSAFLKKNKTINGMFYIFKSEKIISLGLYHKIKQKLCDDYELARAARAAGMDIYQSIIPCKLNTETKGFFSFLRLMRRWHVFVNHYVKENLDMSVIIFSIVPFISGGVFLIISLVYRYEVFLIYLTAAGLNSIIGKKIRKKVFRENEGIKDMFLEILSSVIQIFYWVLALVKPSQIIWRGKAIKIKNGIIEVNSNGKKDKG